MKEKRYGPHKLYKGKFFLVFYDESDEKSCNIEEYWRRNKITW